MVEAPEILVVGARGMLGTEIVEACRERGIEVIGLDVGSIDIRDSTAVLNLPVPTVLINCAAYTSVDKAEDEQAVAYGVNVKGVSNLVRFCKRNNIPIVHISTDYVFDGTKDSYDEDETPAPINYYGQTKAESEEHATSWKKHFLVRTSWMFGKHGKNFVQTVLDRTEPMEVVDDQRGKPTYAYDLARSILDLLKKPYGTYHITNEGETTWYEFAREVAKQGKKDIEITPCTTEDYPTKAKRPKNSVLNNNKTEKLRDWEDAVTAYLTQ